MKYYVTFLVKFLLYSSAMSFVKSEFFTAVVDLEPLLFTEGEIVKTLDKYLEIEEKRLESVRWLRKQYDKLYKAAMSDVDSFLSNPVNAYLLVKRLTTDWQTAGRLIEGSMSKAVIENVTLQSLKFPDDEDLQGAASALMRLQDTYLLDTTKLASGHIAGTTLSTELTASDCFELGHQAYSQQDHYHTVLWMQEALDRLEQEDFKTMSRTAILEHIAHSSFLLGNPRHALKLTQDILIADPDYLPAHGNLQFFLEQVKLQQERIRDVKEEDIQINDDHHHFNVSAHRVQPSEIWQTYQRLCRGEQMRTAKEESRLYCHYTTGKSFYLLLQPVKEEILSLDPWIVVYHDIINDEDANLFKLLAMPNLSRTKVVDPKSGLLESASFRVSKSAWLNDDLHPRIYHAGRIVGEVTGLILQTAEDLHIINYGIGGHYTPHYDFKMPDDTELLFFKENGNRIATWIYYLSDVDAGGSTVFPDIGVQIQPKKGSAGFWYNLKKSGDGDLKTRHAGCPVLAGNKWVANKWLHEKNQHFRRPCTLNPLE